MSKMIIFPGVFSILKCWFSRQSGGYKGKKWPKMTKISAWRTIWSSFMVHMYMYIIRGSDVEGGRGGGGVKGKKWPKMTKNSACLTLYIRNCTSYYCDFWYTFVKWWHLQQSFSFFKSLIFWDFRGGGVKGQKVT